MSGLRAGQSSNRAQALRTLPAVAATGRRTGQPAGTSHPSHWLKTLSRIDLVILDDFDTVPLSPRRNRCCWNCSKAATSAGLLLTSQLPLKLWHAQFHDPTLADAILDRLVHGAELVELKGESMRKRAQAAPPAEDKDNQKP
ncbi:MAG: ATP-binding protein [Xanthomonadales bacterium]|nr:ATP-binding protein [Xanthomonadales bacterium]